jgi:hypothetical protein
MNTDIGFIDWIAILGIAALAMLGLFVAAHAVLG